MSIPQPESHGYGSVVLAGNIPVDHLPDRPGEWQIRQSEWEKSQEPERATFYYGCWALKKANRDEWPTCAIPIQKGVWPKVSKGCWAWDSSTTKPSISPSIFCQTSGCGWHGFKTPDTFSGTYDDAYANKPQP